MDMLSGLQNKGKRDSSLDSKVPTEPLDVLPNISWMETPDDVVTSGSEQWMSHQERQTLIKNRTYSATEPA
jgi:hypothetical protein